MKTCDCSVAPKVMCPCGEEIPECIAGIAHMLVCPKVSPKEFEQVTRNIAMRGAVIGAYGQ